MLLKSWFWVRGYILISFEFLFFTFFVSLVTRDSGPFLRLWQRIPRYRLLLETILQHTPIASTMHSKVEESLTTMGGIAAKINEGVSLQRQKHKVCL